jgi:DNA-binding beta-propeller fold protein YncE
MLPSGGAFPVSLAVQGDAVYVLNAGSAANVSGLRIADGRLHPLRDDIRTLGLYETNPPQFLASPAQVGFTPNGRQLIVTDKTNNFIDVFAGRGDDHLAGSLVQTPTAAFPSPSPSPRLTSSNWSMRRGTWHRVPFAT